MTFYKVQSSVRIAILISASPVRNPVETMMASEFHSILVTLHFIPP